MTRRGDRLEYSRLRQTDSTMERLDRKRIRHVALVVLEDDGKRLESLSIVGERAAQLVDRRRIRLDPSRRAIEHEDHPVDLVEELLARHRLVFRARDGDDLDLHGLAADLAEGDREGFRDDRRVEARGRAHELAARLRAKPRVDRAQRRRFSRALDAPEQDAGVCLAHQTFPFFVRIRRAWVLMLLGTSLLFIRLRRSRSWR